MNKLRDLAKKGKINDEASIKDQHSKIVNASIKKVWEVLIDIKKWPEWHEHIKSVELDARAQMNTEFKWSISGYTVKSKVLQFEAPYFFSWVEKTKWIKGVYTWHLEETDGHQTIVNTSHSIQGVLTLLIINHEKLHKDMLSWLEYLKKAVEK